MQQLAPEPQRLGILMVGDGPQIVDMLLRFLPRHGHQSTGAGDATTASALAKADPQIGVVTSDVRMPGVDGLQLTEVRRRDRPEEAAIEVVLLTGGAGTDVALGALRAGTFGLLQKPPRLAEVAEVMDRAIVRGAARAQAEVHAAMQAALAESTRLAAAAWKAGTGTRTPWQACASGALRRSASSRWRVAARFRARRWLVIAPPCIYDLETLGCRAAGVEESA
ncbi:response regulator [Falsiroseomonas tokyonensis]|uniref:Response regulator n=1 Tax=Falsiroseomonas tokyonensis TaxID=430521 RepID=A0ABV7BP03_9PROT|nr:response regulator [Falsiroseomonas tokyonensis]MBU8537343.1 response regulator [Falsiroseomonas tokyonensis]